MRKVLYVFLIIFIIVALVLGIKVSKNDSFVPPKEDYDFMKCEGTLEKQEEYPILQKDNLSVSVVSIFTDTVTKEDLQNVNLTEEELNNVIIQEDTDNFAVLVEFKSLDGTSINELSCDFQIYDIVNDTCNIYLTSITQVKNDLMDAFDRYMNLDVDNDSATNYKFNRIGTAYKRFIVKQTEDSSIVLFSTFIPEENKDSINHSIHTLIINPQYEDESGKKVVLNNTFFDLFIR